MCQSQSTKLSLPSPFPLGNHIFFFLFLWLFLFCKYAHFYIFFFLDSTYKQYQMIFIFDLLYSIWSSLDLSMQLQRTLFHSIIWLSNIPLYTCTTSSLSILPWNILSEFFSPIYYSIYYPSPPPTEISLLPFCTHQGHRWSNVSSNVWFLAFML